ncbi:hypothetical protein UJ101_02248 [Flavobacteriaceae bacterium UJ101]|nr:hypothetical protein UJ101_02248 [Flavobacteriaceae bacterium UJ101]
MKHLKSIFFIATVLFAFSLSAQESKGITANELLKSLNNVDELGVDASKQAEFKDLNSSFVQQLKSLATSSYSKQEKKSKFNDLFKQRNNDLESLFGSKSAYEKYKKKANKTLKKTKRKAKWSLVKMVL